jgi:hypothetical protein
MLIIAVAFTLVFSIFIVPASFSNPDIIVAPLAGFVNPFLSDFSANVLFLVCFFGFPLYLVLING